MKYGVWWVSVDKKEQKEYFDSETARMEKIKELMGMKLPWKLIPERGPEKVTTARDVLRMVEEAEEGETYKPQPYCTQPRLMGEGCETCSLSNYGRDCQNNPIQSVESKRR